jgi:hypothetical protein
MQGDRPACETRDYFASIGLSKMHTDSAIFCRHTVFILARGSPLFQQELLPISEPGAPIFT